MSKCEVERERESVERKQLYLHEAYLGSRLQNNGRKRVHGTFPFERACVPLSRVSWPRAALRSTETSLSVGSSGLEGGRVYVKIFNDRKLKFTVSCHKLVVLNIQPIFF